ncbi:MAG TPA: MATE family efflux transporter, partial [Bacteroidia bacterium]|nr:MATE family efflux transporter [Bacteroidia bacterium]
GLIGYLAAPEILKLMGAQQRVIDEGVPFTKLMMASSPAVILLFLINGIFRGAGDAAMAMKSLWLASGVNIVLCPLLVFGYGPFPEMGLVGAAIATIIGRSSGVLFQCFHLFSKSRTIQLLKTYFKWDAVIIQNLLTVATPATLQFFIQSGSWIILTYLVSVTGSTEASAGYQIAIRNIAFFMLPAWGLSNAAATLVGQNLGAKQPERAEKSVWLTARYNIIFMMGVTILFLFFSPGIVNLFTSETGVHYYATLALQVIGIGYIFYGLGMVMIQALNGAGDTKTPTWINVICFWLIQVPFAWLLSVQCKMGPLGAFVAIPFAEVILAVIAWYWFKKGNWKKVKV